MSLRLDTLQTLNGFQRFLGDINWIRPSLKITNVAILQLRRQWRGRRKAAACPESGSRDISYLE
ncbi:hypothetical protein ACQP3J_28480, partial [Escherichia coli]